MAKSPAWQRKEGKAPSGGLNAKGRASYNRETGGNLKAPQPEGGSRRDSFCARMSGMKKKLTNLLLYYVTKALIISLMLLFEYNILQFNCIIL